MHRKSIRRPGAEKTRQRASIDEIDTDLAAADDYIARHGSFADMARTHFAASDDDSDPKESIR